jgi:hypothetical protein
LETKTLLITPIVATETHLDSRDTNTINQYQSPAQHTMSTVNCLQNQAPPTAWSKGNQAPSAASTTPETIGFEVPRELRDDIYDLLYLEDEHKPNGLDKAEVIKGEKSGYTVYTQTQFYRHAW